MVMTHERSKQYVWRTIRITSMDILLIFVFFI